MLDDYGALIRSGQAIIPDFAEQEARRQLLDLRNRELDLQVQQAQEQINAKQAFDTDLANLLTNPTAEGYAQMIAKHPKFATQIKQSHDILDDSRKRADLTQMAEIYSAAANGRHDLAAQLMRRRVEADKAADGKADPTDEAMLAALESNDPVQQKAALGMMGVGLSAITGPDKFQSTLGELTKKDEAFTLGPGMTRYAADGSVIAAAPFAPRPITVGEGQTIVEYQPGGGGPASGSPGALAPAESAVSSVLSTAGLPAPVIAGALGNFSIEGGYGGAKGDGGTAAGIAQWRGERQENFKRIIGKPVEQSTPDEQARFFLWEMQNPEAAGMKVEQRDAILAAKTPAQAAALLDQHYFRSDGSARNQRMTAANNYAGRFGGGANPDGSMSMTGGNTGGNTGGPKVIAQGAPKPVKPSMTRVLAGKTYYKIDGRWFDNPEGK